MRDPWKSKSPRELQDYLWRVAANKISEATSAIADLTREILKEGDLADKNKAHRWSLLESAFEAYIKAQWLQNPVQAFDLGPKDGGGRPMRGPKDGSGGG